MTVNSLLSHYFASAWPCQPEVFLLLPFIVPCRFDLLPFFLCRDEVARLQDDLNTSISSKQDLVKGQVEVRVAVCVCSQRELTIGTWNLLAFRAISIWRSWVLDNSWALHGQPIYFLQVFASDVQQCSTIHLHVFSILHCHLVYLFFSPLPHIMLLQNMQVAAYFLRRLFCQYSNTANHGPISIISSEGCCVAFWTMAHSEAALNFQLLCFVSSSAVVRNSKAAWLSCRTKFTNLRRREIKLWRHWMRPTRFVQEIRAIFRRHSSPCFGFLTILKIGNVNLEVLKNCLPWVRSLSLLAVFWICLDRV